MADQRERLLAHIRTYVGKKKRIDDGVRLYHDLGIGGDDAFEMLDKVSADFAVDFSKMQFSEYFPNETEAMPEHFGRLLGSNQKEAVDGWSFASGCREWPLAGAQHELTRQAA